MRAAYLLVLLGCFLGTLPLELVWRAHVYRRARRWLLALAPVFVVFVAWDLWAIARGHWDYDPAQVSGLTLPGNLPLEEALFFVVIPTCALLTFEAVRRVTGWDAGDGDDGG
jgi:lycopene cyclase domain-containing protein